MMGFQSALLVINSVVYQKIIKRVFLEIHPEIKITVDNNGSLVSSRNEKLPYDLIVIDMNMYSADVLEILDEVHLNNPDLPVVVLSDPGERSRKHLEIAIKKGIFAHIIKPLEENYESNLNIVKEKMQKILERICNPESLNKNSFTKTIAKPKDAFSLMLVASSTGGPIALENIITRLPGDFPVPILIVQHMPQNFTKNLAISLDKKSKLSVREAAEGDKLEPGSVLIAPGGYHLVLDNNKRVTLNQEQLVNGVRPSADVCFASVAYSHKTEAVIAVILTGMGCDGLIGVRELKKFCDCYCITQDERSCVVYGMPRSVYEAGYSDRVLDVSVISTAVERLVSRRLKS